MHATDFFPHIQNMLPGLAMKADVKMFFQEAFRYFYLGQSSSIPTGHVVTCSKGQVVT